MAYKSLKSLYYEDRERYEEEYGSRFASEYAHHLPFRIKEYEAFYVVTPEIQKMLVTVRQTDKRVGKLCRELPNIALEQFAERCLIDEIVLSNKIEGVRSTRKEISTAIYSTDHSRKQRFLGLVNKYDKLLSGENIPLETSRDIRTLYDEIVLEEVVAADASNAPDGLIFRKDSVSVTTATQKEIHQGLYPENRIIEAMDAALAYLNDEKEDILLRTSVFHYLFGYIHPFYDGNGRLNRFISSYMLSKELETVMSYRLSYTVQNNLKNYYDAFSLCNNPISRGDLTPFVEMFMKIIDTSMISLEEALIKRKELLDRLVKKIPSLPGGDDELRAQIYYLLIQAELYSDSGITTEELMSLTGKSRETIRKKMLVMKETGMLKTVRVGKEKHYGIWIKERAESSEQ